MAGVLRVQRRTTGRLQ